MTARIALGALFVVAAVLARPWQTDLQRWVLAVSIVAVVLLFAWWGGLFLTTRIARALAMWRRNRSKDTSRPADPARETVVLRLDQADRAQLPIVVAYLDRYGIACDTVRVTHRDANGARRSWISLTVAATDNLAALRARSPRIPLRDTAEVVGRRLAHRLREEGWSVTMVDGVDSPVPEAGTETWRGMKDESGFVAAYRVRVTDALDETLAAIAALESPETWTALEFTGDPAAPGLVVGCAVRTTQRPGAKAPVTGLTPVPGRHRPALEALHPLSSTRLTGDPVRWAAPVDLGADADADAAIRTA
jgi:type VII secretion protein EccE